MRFQSCDIGSHNIVPAWLDQFCQTKIENLGAIIFCDEDVLGLEVAVDDPLLVGSGENRERSSWHSQCLRWEQIRAKESRVMFAFEQLRHDIRRACVITNVVDCENVWMVQCAAA